MKYLILLLFFVSIFACSNSEEISLKDNGDDLQLNTKTDTSSKLCKLTGGEEVTSGWEGNDTASNHCNQCSCANGNLICTEMACHNDENIFKKPPQSTMFCKLTGGEEVSEGWSGNDTGNNFCNKCRCMNGALACTRMACIPKDSSSFAPPTKIAVLPTKTATPIPTVVITPVLPTQIATPVILDNDSNNRELDSDFSDDPKNPTFLEFSNNEILISDGFGGFDRDYITFTVPENSQVKSIILKSFTGEDDIAFFALENKNKYTALDDISKMISYGHFGPGTDFNNIGSDILYYDKNTNQKTREKVVLESGDYTFRLQQGNSANASYSFIVYLD